MAVWHVASTPGGHEETINVRGFWPPPVDREILSDLHDTAARKVLAIVRDKPYMALAGAFASGFLLGGGWRTRLGHVVLLAAAPCVVSHVARRYLVA